MASDVPTFIQAFPSPQVSLAPNSIPSDDERNATQMTITTIDGEIVNLRPLLEPKERQRAIHEVIQRHKSVICLIKTLVPELLAEISCIHCQATALMFIPKDFHSWKIPLMVSHISRKWRDIAICTSRL